MEINTYTSRLKEMAGLECSLSFICPGYRDLNRFNGTFDKETCKFCHKLIIGDVNATYCPCDALGEKVAKERTIEFVRKQQEN